MTRIAAGFALLLAVSLGAGAAHAANTVPTVNPASRVMLNPQPLPPGGGAMATNPSFANPGNRVMLNPQPLPPKTR